MPRIAALVITLPSASWRRRYLSKLREPTKMLHVGIVSTALDPLIFRAARRAGWLRNRWKKQRRAGGNGKRSPANPDFRMVDFIPLFVGFFPLFVGFFPLFVGFFPLFVGFFPLFARVAEFVLLTSQYQ